MAQCTAKNPYASSLILRDVGKETRIKGDQPSPRLLVAVFLQLLLGLKPILEIEPVNPSALNISLISPAAPRLLYKSFSSIDLANLPAEAVRTADRSFNGSLALPPCEKTFLRYLSFLFCHLRFHD